MTLEVLRTRDLPFSLMTTTHSLLIVADGEGTQIYTYCPQFGVMRGLGDFDDRPRMYTPKCLQLFDAPVEDLRRMKREWEAAALTNERFGIAPLDTWANDAPVPFVANIDELSTAHPSQEDAEEQSEIWAGIEN